MKSGIYMILNKANNKVYIGQSINLDSRMDGHLRELRKGTHINNHLQGAFNKYGESNFEFIILCKEPFEQLNTLEQYYILNFESYDERFGYNHNYGGKNGRVPQEVREKISESLKGDKNPFYGKTHNEKTKRILREVNIGENNPAYGRIKEKHPMYGKHHTEEAKEKMRQKLKGSHYQKVGEENINSKEIYCIELHQKFVGIKNAGRILGIAPQSITACVNKRRKTAGKSKDGKSLHWIYYSEYLESIGQ